MIGSVDASDYLDLIAVRGREREVFDALLDALAQSADWDALDLFAKQVDVVTYEFENVPAETAAFLAARKPVLPDPHILAITQDRLAEKNFVAGLNIQAAYEADKMRSIGAGSESANFTV